MVEYSWMNDKYKGLLVNMVKYRRMNDKSKGYLYTWQNVVG